MAFESQVVRDARINVAAVLGAVVRRLPRILLVTGLLLAATFVILMFMPRMYESSASILVEPRSNVYTRASNEQAPSVTGGEAGVVSSQIELIKSRDTLLRVIDQLDLRSIPEFNGTSSAGGFSPLGVVTQLLGRRSTPVSVDETVLSNLYERLTVIQERDSRIISVLVRSTSPQLAADIANAVAAAHVARRASLSLSDTAEASGWMSEEIAKLRVSVMEAETAVATFKVNNDLFIGSNNTSLLDQQLSTVATQISSAQERKNAALSRAALIRGMIQRGQPIDGISDVRQSVIIQQLSQEKARLQGEMAQRSATLLRNHPAILALAAQIAELNNQISIEGRRVADALEAEAQIEADLETSLQADLTRAKSSASTATQDTVTLDGLQREAKAQRDLLEGYLQRYSEAVSRVDSSSALPDVRVVTEAAPAVSPASPKTAFILLAVGIVALATQLGLVIFGELISGRAIIPGAAPSRGQDELDSVPFNEGELEPEQKWTDPASEAAEPDVAPVLAAVTSVPDDAPIVAEAAPVAPVVARAEGPKVVALADLSSDLVLGRTHLVLLAAHGSNVNCEVLAEELVGDALSRGLSVALVDAGSGRREDELGMSDLSADGASFGDVVHKSADNSFAEVPWGTARFIAPNSGKPLTLVEALGDIYEVVVLMTGRVGKGSSLPMFEGVEGRLVLVVGPEDDLDEVAVTRSRLLESGFDRCEIAAAPARVAA
ncbi:GumC family protein [Devosia sp. 2618]|uniref:GumC family protein n=1 Tax=Devosia sp. 2618 TaxID=3156454 RepID=UPI0033950E1B